MAYQPETANYDVGVYELEIDDPVQGGPGGLSNAPLLNLANRTAWLYQELNGVISGTIVPTGLAPLNSPQFTGSPTTPTPALGDNSLAIANTSWVQSTVSGVLSLSVAGGANVTLTTVQAGSGILSFTGALTANIAVIVPAGGKWIVFNNTTGAYTLTVKTAAGSGVVVAQGKRQEVYCDGTNVNLAITDFATAFISATLTGVPTAPTANIGSNTTQIANTQFVATAFAAALPLSGGIMTGILKTLTQSETATSPTISSGTLVLNLALSNVFQVTLSANVTTLTISNPPASGTAFAFTVVLTASGTAYSVTWPSSILWPGGSAPTLTATSGKKDRFVFETTDGGTTYRASAAGQNF